MKYKLNRQALAQRLKELEVTREGLSIMLEKEGINITKNGIHSWLRTKDPRQPTFKTAKVVAELLKMDDSILIQRVINTSRRLPRKKDDVARVRIIGWASCGTPITSEYSDNDFVCIPTKDHVKDMYAIIACGDSMSPEIDDGDRVICDPKAPLQNYDLVHYTLFGESGIKVYTKENDIIRLIPFNQSAKFMTQTIMPTDKEILATLDIVRVAYTIKSNINNRKARQAKLGALDK